MDQALRACDLEMVVHFFSSSWSCGSVTYILSLLVNALDFHSYTASHYRVSIGLPQLLRNPARAQHGAGAVGGHHAANAQCRQVHGSLSSIRSEIVSVLRRYLTRFLFTRSLLSANYWTNELPILKLTWRMLLGPHLLHHHPISNLQCHSLLVRRLHHLTLRFQCRQTFLRPLLQTTPFLFPIVRIAVILAALVAVLL